MSNYSVRCSVGKTSHYSYDAADIMTQAIHPLTGAALCQWDYCGDLQGGIVQVWCPTVQGFVLQ